ncbi:TPA: phage tail protein, partial [Proteus mirabilis]
MKGLAQAIKNLNSINDEMVPKATAMAINRVARRVISHSVKRVSAETKVPQRLIRQRVRLNRASSRYKTPRARLVINRGNLPAIALGNARVQLSRKRGNQKGAGSVLKVGRFSFPH